MTDPWAPWASADQRAVADVFDLEGFDVQVRALLELAPKASAKEVAALPWEEVHAPREFRAIRDAWAAERAVKRDEERAGNEKPITEVLFDQFSTGIRLGNLKDAKTAFELMKQVAGSKSTVEQRSEDDWDRLTEVETLVLGALIHKLRDEPLTEFDQSALEFVGKLGQ